MFSLKIFLSKKKQKETNIKESKDENTIPFLLFASNYQTRCYEQRIRYNIRPMLINLKKEFLY